MKMAMRVTIYDLSGLPQLWEEFQYDEEVKLLGSELFCRSGCIGRDDPIFLCAEASGHRVNRGASPSTQPES